ncbi:MAG: hypothetical protein RLY31_255 [Bacteroidota bacterium]|jgi:glycerol-3-phosphate dehydrogenase
MVTTQRKETLTELTTKNFDLVVIGGGITGAGIALDASSRGLSVLLLEKTDFAAGTSSKSTKLIHGGLRYLKQLEFRLVQEVGRERAIVHRLAPHLVKAEKMLLPIFQNGTFGKHSTAFGLWLYDLLAGVRQEDRRTMLNRAETLDREPLIHQAQLLGGGFYAEYRTDDARLTIELIKTAVRYGARCLNYAEVRSFQYSDNGRLTGLTFLDSNGGESLSVQARHIVSAAGPWVDRLREKDGSLTGKQIFLSKGVHVVVPRERLPIRHAVYFDIPDGRMLFAIPRHRTTYIGTTDTPYQGDRDQVFADAADVDYILEGTNQMFPSAKLNTADVESTWAGLRPLIFETGKSAGEMSRKDEIFSSPTGLISIAGGKLTGYRKMAARVVDLVMRNRVAEGLDTFRPCETHRIPLLAGEPLTAASLPLLRETIRQKVRSEDLPDFHTDYLLENYGPDAVRILSDMSSYDDLRPDTRLLRAELQHAIRHEWVLEPADFLERRTGRLYFHIRSIEDNLPVILADMGRLLSWTAEKAAAAESDIRELVRRVKVFG